MCSLGTGKQSDRLRLSRWSHLSEFDIDALVTQEFHQRSSMQAPLPVSPQKRMQGGKWKRRSRLLGCVA